MSTSTALPIQEGVVLASFTAMKVGGPAQYFLQARSNDDIIAGQAWARERTLPVFLLGGGSNVLVSDRGIAGLVIRVVSDRADFSGDMVHVDAGYNLSRLAAAAAERSLAGLEFAMGIPGTVGGAIRGNAGAFDGEMKDIVTTVSVLTETGEIVERTNAEMDFRYRHSVLKTTKDIVLSAVLQLRQGEQQAIRAVQHERLAYRKANQPLEYPSLGSTFKNVPLRTLDPALEDRYQFSKIAKNGMVAAGYLIEGLELKGFTVGGAQVSEKHANFIINTGNATAEQIMMLIGIIQQKARVAYHGLRLEPEVQFVGF